MLSTLFHTPSLMLLLSIALIVAVVPVIEYYRSTYYKQTLQHYFAVKGDVGKFGEYQIYRRLKKLEKQGAKFLFNTYIPKPNGETTEIDVLMICDTGIFVFESKNYSGWIFGSENQKNWYQTLPVGKGRRSQKESFFNPIMQNRVHLTHLKSLVGEHIPMHSVIVFSERCTLKNIHKESTDIYIINRDVILNIVSNIGCTVTQPLSSLEITELYNLLYPYTQIDELEKAKHISDIQNRLHPNSVQPAQPVVSNDTTPSDQPTSTAESTAQKCPKCNAPLVLRTATKGQNAGMQFYGCSNYPKCRYIKPIK